MNINVRNIFVLEIDYFGKLDTPVYNNFLSNFFSVVGVFCFTFSIII